MIGGEKVKLKVYLKMVRIKFRPFIWLTIIVLSACSYTDDEEKYLDLLISEFPEYQFDLPDRITNLDLRLNLKNTEFDTVRIIKAFKRADYLKDKHPDVSWVYMMVFVKGEYSCTIGNGLGDEIVFMKKRN